MHVFVHVQAKHAVGVDMTVDQRCEGSPILLFHLLELLRISKHALNQQGIDGDERDL